VVSLQAFAFAVEIRMMCRSLPCVFDGQRLVLHLSLLILCQTEYHAWLDTLYTLPLEEYIRLVSIGIACADCTYGGIRFDVISSWLFPIVSVCEFSFPILEFLLKRDTSVL